MQILTSTDHNITGSVARIEGRQPIAVTHHADTVEDAGHSAAGKLATSIKHTLGRAAGPRRPERV